MMDLGIRVVSLLHEIRSSCYLSARVLLCSEVSSRGDI